MQKLDCVYKEGIFQVPLLPKEGSPILCHYFHDQSKRHIHVWTHTHTQTHTYHPLGLWEWSFGRVWWTAALLQMTAGVQHFLSSGLLAVSNVVTNSFKRWARSSNLLTNTLESCNRNLRGTHAHTLSAHPARVQAQRHTRSSHTRPESKVVCQWHGSSVDKIASACVLVCVPKQHRCSQGHRGRNRPSALWTWSWKESCLPFLSKKLNCYASELQSAQTGRVKSSSHSFIHWKQSHQFTSFHYTLRWNNLSDRHYQQWSKLKPLFLLMLIFSFYI